MSIAFNNRLKELERIAGELQQRIVALETELTRIQMAKRSPGRPRKSNEA